jgi:DNA-binding transcriptional LysR family regulator
LDKFDLNLLAPLDALLREKNVTVAADQLGVSQPTMSGMLNRLREHLNDPLLIRVGRSFELTPMGKEIAEKVRQTLLGIDSLVVPKANFELSKAVRHIRIMASDVSLLLIVPFIFRRAAELAPNLTFEVVPIDSPVAQVYQGNVDLCLTGDTVAHIDGGAANTVRTKILVSDRPVGIVDSNHPLSGTITLDEFLAYPYVAAQFPGAKRTADDNIMDGLSHDHPPRIRVPSFMAIGSVVCGTQMIGILPSRMVPLLPEVWNLRALDLPAGFSKLSLRVLWHSRHDNDRVHQWLRSTAQAACADEALSDAARPH